MPLRYQDLEEGQALGSWTYHVSREDLRRYAAASGDQNPIHQDESFARSVGLPDVIAHGMHTMARIGQFVTDLAGDPVAVRLLRTRFTAPVVVPEAGSDVTVSGTVGTKRDGKRVALELVATSAEGTQVASSVAEIVLS